MSEQFSLTRFAYLLRSDLVNRYRSLAIVSGTLAALMLVHGLLTAAFSQNPDNIFAVWGVGMLFIWGAIAASKSFSELHDKNQNEAFLLLPASALEKVVSRLLLVTVGLGLYIIVFTNVVSWLNALLGFVTFGRRDLLFPPFGANLRMLAFFLVQQSLFFAGAAWFRKNHFIKTAFTLTVGAIGLAVFTGIVVNLVFPEIRDPAGAELFEIDMTALYAAYEPYLRVLLGFLAFAYFVVLPVLCWLLAWMRVRETQVSHGV